MKIKFTKDTIYKSGPRAEWPRYKAGDVHEFEEDHAQRWLRRGVAKVWDHAAQKAEKEEAERQAEVEAQQKASDGSPDLNKLTRAELELLAADRKVDITQAKNKGEIIEALDKAAAAV